MKNVTRITLSIAAGALFLTAAAVQAGIIGSPHDFSGETWSTRPGDPNTVCSVCHTPHHADPNLGPLWNHTSSGGGFTMYTEATAPGYSMKTDVDATPAPSSLACLSCHDGTVAVNSYGGSIQGSPYVLTNSANLTKDLSHTHPISFTYDNSLVALDQWLYDPDSTQVTPPVGQGSGPFVSANDMSINGFLLNGNHRLECSSCHDVHNQEGSPYNLQSNPKLVKIVGVDAQNNGSLLCRACHNK